MDTCVHEAFRTSAETGQLDAALARAQAKITVARKNKVNPHFGQEYADLAAVWAACRQALSEEKIAVSQWPLHSVDGRLHLLTRLAVNTDTGAQWMHAHFSLPVGKADAQGFVSAITYAKRAALGAAVGVVAADEDDDGQGAVQPAKSSQRRETKTAPGDYPDETTTDATIRIGKAEVARLRAALRAHGQDEKQFAGYLAETYGYKAWTHIPRERYASIMELAEGGQDDNR